MCGWVFVGVVGSKGVVCGYDVKGVCLWRWIPSFTLEYVELVSGRSLGERLTGSSSGVSSVMR